MPPSLLLDLDSIDLSQVLYDSEVVEEVNPHRHEMRHLDGIIHADSQEGLYVGFKDVRADEFWVRGHIPGRPIMPGVIMIEAAAQLASFCVQKFADRGRKGFIGFGGIEDAKFRGTVTPPSRLYLIAKLIENRPRRFICATQGVVDGKMVFEAKIIGMPI